MGTEKRDRQRANRAEKKAAEAKVERRQKTMRLVRRVAIYGLIAAAVLVLANLFLGGSADGAVGIVSVLG